MVSKVAKMKSPLTTHAASSPRIGGSAKRQATASVAIPTARPGSPVRIVQSSGTL
jgi:hypothetical protein